MDGRTQSENAKIIPHRPVVFCPAAAREQFDHLIERRSGKATSFTTLRAKIIANQLILRCIYIVRRANAIIVLDPQLMRSIKFHLRRK
jgi:hypothetical protein